MRDFMTKRLTHDEWMIDLVTPGRKLTLEEFVALEAGLAHGLLGEVHMALGMNPQRHGGTLEQIRNLLDAGDGMLRTQLNGLAHGH